MEFNLIATSPFNRKHSSPGLTLIWLSVFAWLFGVLGNSSTSADTLRIHRGDKVIEIEGEVLIEAQDESILFQQRDGQLLILKAEEIETKEIVEEPTEPFTPKEMGERLLQELPDGFRIHNAGQYVIAYQTEYQYAKWIGGLYEKRLHKAYKTFWKKKKFKLESPEFPFVAIVFKSKEEYTRYVQRELGEEPGSMVAYYNLMTNRVAMYDLTAGLDAGSRPIHEVLQDPRAIPMVATIIHEGTHQLVFNTGMQTRLAESPLWMNEGLSIYFETPNLNNKNGWRLPGLLNHDRLFQFRQTLNARPENSLETLVSDNSRFQNPETSLDAYAEAWALNYFLLREKPKEFVKYIKFMSQKKRLETDTSQQRLQEFKRFFGEDLSELDQEFLAYVYRL